MPKKAKSTTPKLSPEKSLRPTVISFRITEAQTEKLHENFENDSALGVRSSNQYARKVVADFLAGRLVYKNPEHRKRDLDVYQ